MIEFRFEKLAVWHKALDFADLTYDLTQAFPADERYGLSSQLKRASVSVSSNIAEGSGRISDTEFARFLEFSYGSLMEVVSQAHLSQRRGFVSMAELDQIRNQALELSRMLSGLRTKLTGQ